MFDPNDPATFSVTSRYLWRNRWFLCGGAGLAFLVTSSFLIQHFLIATRLSNQQITLLTYALIILSWPFFVLLGIAYATIALCRKR